MSRARDIADFADGNITSATISTLNSTTSTITNLVSTSASVNTANLIQSSVSSKPLIIKSTAPQTATITGAEISSGSVIYSIASASTIFSVNDLVTITGITPDTLNDTRATVGAVSASSITIFNGRQGTYSSGGTATRIHANLLEIQNSAGTALSTIRSDGSATGGFNSGLTLLNTTTFSGVSAFNFPNDTFSATYDNYKIVLSLKSSTSNFLAFRGRTSGTSNSNANYTFQFVDIGGTGVAALRTVNATSGRVASVTSTTIPNGYAIDLFSPFINEPTTFSSRGYNSATNASFQDYIGTFYNAAIFDSIEFLASTGTVTGKAYLYGYSQ